MSRKKLNLILLWVLMLCSSSLFSRDDRKKYETINYSLLLSFDKELGEIKTIITNKSTKEISLRKDALPSSLLLQGIRFHAFLDSKDLTPVPLLLPMGSNSENVVILPQENIVGRIKIKNVIPDYCGILERSPILIFWEYSAMSGEDVLRPSSGLLRVERYENLCSSKK